VMGTSCGSVWPGAPAERGEVAMGSGYSLTQLSSVDLTIYA
jgi:hypothetical protein